MKTIVLTGVEGLEIYINPKHIVSFHDVNVDGVFGHTIITMSHQKGFRVIEKSEDIDHMLDQAYGRVH